MGDPIRDPHGEPIPTADLTMPQDESTPLSSLRQKQTATITRVIGSDLALLRYLDDLNMTPGTHIEIVNYSPFDHNLTIRVGRRSFVLGLGITSKVFVEERG